MNKKVAAVAALASLQLAVAAQSAAAESGFYFGFGGGESSFDVDATQDDFDAIVSDAFAAEGLAFSGVSRLDDSDSGFGGMAGYRFAPFLAIEAEYMDLGELSYTAEGIVLGLPGSPDATANIDLGVRGPAVSAVGFLPLSDAIELFGRAGVFFADTELSAGASIQGEGDFDSTSSSSAEGVFGVGLAYNLRETWTFRLEYRFFPDVGDDEVGETDVDFVSLGAVIRL